MSSISAFNLTNPYLAASVNPTNQAQAVVQQTANLAASSAAVGAAASPVRGQTVQAVTQSGASDSSRSVRARDDGGKGGDSRTNKLSAENSAASAARGGRRPGTQINILV